MWGPLFCLVQEIWYVNPIAGVSIGLGARTGADETALTAACWQCTQALLSAFKSLSAIAFVVCERRASAST